MLRREKGAARVSVNDKKTKGCVGEVEEEGGGGGRTLMVAVVGRRGGKGR